MPLYRFREFVFTLRGSLLVLGVVWAVVVLIVGLGGEFCVNDDWSFVRAYENFVSSGRMPSTGWGPNYAPGGPSLVVHVLWARLFTFAAGQSMTVLRLSVMTMGILGSVGMLILLRRVQCTGVTSLLGALALVFNPLYLSQCFTFMSDITFTALSVYALLFLCLAVQSRSTIVLILGFGFCLGAILVRQIGVVIVAAFLWMCLVHPAGKSMGFVRSLAISVCVVIIPWFIYEFGLLTRNGTNLFSHQVMYNLIKNFTERAWLGYAKFLAFNLIGALAYCGLFTSPVWILRFEQFLRKKGFVVFLGIAISALVLVEIGILTRWLNPPVFFWGNVVLDFGIGPILLKDAYILKIHRLGHLEPWAYYAWVFVAVLGVGIIVGRTRIALAWLFKSRSERAHTSFAAGLTFWSALIYLALICVSSFHDRYLIPLIAWLLVWLAAEDPERRSTGKHWPAAAALAMVGLIGILSLAGMRDFMEMKRAQYKAQQYVTTQMGLDPCSLDGGFEFNGYHCYNSAYAPTRGRSWWWVHEEKAVLSLGPLPGYRIQQVFPFNRVLGPHGGVYVLTPEPPG